MGCQCNRHHFCYWKWCSAPGIVAKSHIPFNSLLQPMRQLIWTWLATKKIFWKNPNSSSSNQGCQMVCFLTKHPNLGKFWRVLPWEMLVYFIDTWSILRSFVIFYAHLVQFVVIWYIFPVSVFCTKKNLATLVPTRNGKQLKTRFLPERS
jgi:hypothetical protein